MGQELAPSCQRTGLWLVHGNLQIPTVWTSIESQLADAYSPDITLTCFREDVWARSAHSFDQWAESFCADVVQTGGIHHRFLLGYSLGGRLALHALLQDPDLWSGVVVVSADPGLVSDPERQIQLAKDLAWGDKFRRGNWAELINEWNALPIFSGRPNPCSPREQEFSRERIAQVFNQFSKGRQANLLPALMQLRHPPILFVSGAEDSRYCDIGWQAAEQCPIISHAIVQTAGHRVPWENPTAFVRLTRDFLLSGL